MRVLIVPSWYPTREKPVTGVFVREQAQALSTEHEVRMLYLDVQARGSKTRPKRLRSSRRGFIEEIIEVRNLPLLWQFNYLLTLAREYRRIKREFQPDIVHCHVAVPAGLGGALLRLLYRVPVVLTEHNSEYTSWLRRVGLRVMAQVAIAAADLVICVSEGQMESLTRAFRRSKPIVLLPNMVDTEAFRPTPLPPMSEGYRLLFVGLMETPQKGVPYLLEAFRMLCDESNSDVHLELIGDGTMRDEYENLAKQLNIADKVSFLGLQTKTEVARALEHSHLLVLPSLHEATPLAIIEALASGRPVVSTKCGGPEYMIDEENGLIVEPGNSSALAKAIQEVLAKLGSYQPDIIARSAQRRYSRSSILATLGVLYSQVTRKK